MSTPSDDRLDSWKAIATYLKRDIRTVQRWEKNEELPVHRHLHEKQGSVHAFKSELDRWLATRVATPASSEVLAEPRKARTEVPAWIIAGLAIAAAGMILWRSSEAEVPASPMKAIPFTTFPGDERNPSFSPGGDQIAFAWNGNRQDNFDIYVKPVGGADEPLRLTNTPWHEVCPAWSPDGRRIAFLQVGSEGRAKVMVMPALAGQAAQEVATTVIRRLDDAFGYLTWSRDSKWIAFCQREQAEEPCGLRAVSLESGQTQPLTATSGLWAGDLEPAFSPDGSRLAFTRIREIGVEDLYVLRLDPSLRPVGAPSPVTILGVAGSAAWLPNSRELVFSAGEYRATRHLWRVSLPDAGGAAKVSKIVDVGEDSVNVAAAAWNGTVRLAYNREILDENVWRLDLGAKTSNKPALVISSTRADYNPSFSPAGDRLVFVSNRSGNSEIWTCDRNGGSPAALTSFAGKLTSNPKWSPDGKTVAFDSRTQGGPFVYTVSVSGGPPRRLTERKGSEPTWSRDGKWIYFASNHEGRSEIWKVPSAGGAPVQVTNGGGVYALESMDGRYLYYARRQYPRPLSLWRLPTAGGSPVKLLDTLERHLNFTVGPDGIYFAEQGAAGEVTLSLYRFADGATKKLATPDKPLSFGMTVAPDGSHLLYSQVDQQGSDLMLVEGFR